MRRAALVLPFFFLPAFAAPPAFAADELGLSSDGVTWAGSLEQPLFDAGVRWVPGDVRTSSFFVRNQAAERGDLTVEVERTVRDQLLQSSFLEISARAGGQPWTSVTAGGLQQLLTAEDLLSGRPVEVEVRVTLDEDAPNETMVLGTDLDFRVTLTQSEIVADAGGDQDGSDGDGSGGLDVDGEVGGEVGGDGPTAVAGSSPDDGDDVDGEVGGFLPGTGSAVPPWLPPVGVVLVGAGAYLIVRRRRDEGRVDELPLQDPALHGS